MGEFSKCAIFSRRGALSGSVGKNAIEGVEGESQDQIVEAGSLHADVIRGLLRDCERESFTCAESTENVSRG